MPPKLAYTVLFVEKMDRAVAFYRDTLGLPLKFQSPEWSEFLTGETTLALHAASPEKPAGHIELGFNVPDIHAFHKELVGKGVSFPMPPAKQDFGGTLARFKDSEGAHVILGGQ